MPVSPYSIEFRPSVSLLEQPSRKDSLIKKEVNTQSVEFVGIVAFTQGSFSGWSTPILPRLQSPDTPAAFPPIDDEEASWVGSVSSLSSVFVIPFWSYSIDKLGRKYTGYMIALPFIVSWVLTLFADSITMLYVAKCLGGLSSGGAGVLVTTYTNDVADDEIRGLVGTFYGALSTVGILFANAAGAYLSYTWFNITCLIQPVAFLVGFFWLPEAPLFLMTKGMEQKAREALKWLSGGGDIEGKFLQAKTRAEEFEKSKKTKVSLSTIMDRTSCRTLLLCLLLMANCQFSCFSPITTYSVTIFQDAGTPLSANVSSIIVSAIMSLGTITSTLVIEKSGRRLLLLSANILVAACLFILGGYFYLKNHGSDVSAIQWLPVTCLSVLIMCVGLAHLPIPFLMTTELPSPQARGVVQSVSIIFVSAGVFVTTKTFTAFSNLTGLYGFFWFYGGSCLLCALIEYLTLPETKGRSSEDIVSQLRSDRYIMSVIAPKQKRSLDSVTGKL